MISSVVDARAWILYLEFLNDAVALFFIRRALFSKVGGEWRIFTQVVSVTDEVGSIYYRSGKTFPHWRTHIHNTTLSFICDMNIFSYGSFAVSIIQRPT
jgi:hypothetical protein